jgi:Short C-terminal domain
MFRRRRPLMRAAVVGGTAYYAGKKVQEGRQQDAEQEEPAQQEEAPQSAPAAPAGGMSDAAIEQLKQLGELKDQGILTEAEFDEQKHKLLYGG